MADRRGFKPMKAHAGESTARHLLMPRKRAQQGQGCTISKPAEVYHVAKRIARKHEKRK